MIKNYVNYITYTRQFSSNTIRNHIRALKQFDNFLIRYDKSANDPENIRLIDVYNFIESLGRRGLTPWTAAWMVDAIRSYLKYCKYVMELDTVDPSKVKSPKVPEKEIWYFSKEEKRSILKLVNAWFWKTEELQLRNKLLTYLFLHTGLRIHEMAKIKVNEIWESLQIIGKGGRRRFVYLRSEILDMIYLYLGKRRVPSDYLFWGYKWEHLTADRICHIFVSMSKACWIHIHAHKFRHTFATDLLHVPWSNIYNVAKLLGHKYISTTQVYLGADNWELKKIQFWLSFA